MTSHELAKKLLDLPDFPVCVKVYNGERTVHHEVDDADVRMTPYSGSCVLLDWESEEF